jgi:hypothetical protein
MDGASANIVLLESHFDGDAVDKKYIIQNIYIPSQKLFLFMDYSHVLKRIRNNVLASGEHKSCTRKLTWSGKPILWFYWTQAYNWDKATNPMRIHQRLTDAHMTVSNEGKMRNKLAEDVLDEEMLHLMELYQRNISSSDHLDGCIAFLQQTSKLVRVFRDMRPVIEMNDDRLKLLEETLCWFTEWEKSVYCGQRGQTSAHMNKMLMSRETRDDLKSTDWLHGIVQKTNLLATKDTSAWTC